MTEPHAHLLGLPAEIRNIIWEFVFPPPHSPASASAKAAIGATTALSPPPSSAPDRVSEENRRNMCILLTCRQIHHEASVLAFGRTAFTTRLQRHSLLIHRLAVLRPAQIRAIRSLRFTTALRHRVTNGDRGAVAWEGDTRPLLFPVYVQCRKLLWEALRLLPGLRSVMFVVGDGAGSKTVIGGARFFFDTVVGVGLVERGKRGELHSWGEKWQVLPSEWDRCIWLVESEDECGGSAEMMGLRTAMAEEKGVKRRVKVELVRL